MNGLAVDVEGGDAGGGEDGNVFFRMQLKMFQEGGFSGAGISGYKKIFRGMIEKIQCSFKIFINFNFQVRLGHARIVQEIKRWSLGLLVASANFSLTIAEF